MVYQLKDYITRAMADSLWPVGRVVAMGNALIHGNVKAFEAMAY